MCAFLWHVQSRSSFFSSLQRRVVLSRRQRKRVIIYDVLDLFVPQECCYSLDSSDPHNYQQLIMFPPYAGHALAYNPSYWHLKELYELEDKEAHDACCDPSASTVNCFFFYSLRPIGECREQIPFRFSKYIFRSLTYGATLCCRCCIFSLCKTA